VGGIYGVALGVQVGSTLIGVMVGVGTSPRLLGEKGLIAMFGLRNTSRKYNPMQSVTSNTPIERMSHTCMPGAGFLRGRSKSMFFKSLI
jgi:hypothetical protein